VFSFPWWVSFIIGFLSLSEEILWVRVSGFRYESLPPAFSFVLACFLVGIALGAAFGKRLCERSKNLYAVTAVVLSVAALVDALTPSFIGIVIARSRFSLAILALAIVVTAALKSTLFPIVHHLGAAAQGTRVGRSVSKIYFGNILGATLGPLVTGFLALDYLGVDECFGVAAAICLLTSVACVLKSARPKLILVTLVASMLASAIAWKTIQPGPGSLGAFAAGGTGSMTHYFSNRHGIIHTALTAQGDFVFGGNVYDGIATANVDTNPNRLDRLYMLALVHPNVKRVLFVGLSAGAWVRSMHGFPDIERIDVVEINPAYLQLTHTYPHLAPLLKDSRIHIHIDDGRRWLRRNPDVRFDAIVQNTTYHWRANIGNLLSREYFSELKEHLNPGGVVIVNTTGSFDVLATMQSVFAHAYRYFNFGYASDQSLKPDVALLKAIRRPDGALFTIEAAPPASVAALLANARLEPVPEFLARRSAGAEIITDDNLLSEYRHGKRFGPAALQALLPPEPAQFEGYDP
jgi:predicted membrane-bound spermidine synthase